MNRPRCSLQLRSLSCRPTLAAAARAVASVVLAGVVGGCGGAVDSGRVKVRMSYWGGDFDRALHRIADVYEQAHPGTDIVLELQSGREYQMWMRVQILGRRPPPVMQAQWSELQQYVRNDRLVPIDPFLDRVNPHTGQTWRQMYFAARLDSVRDARGDLYIIPLNQVKTAIFYNRAIFAECGVEPPETFAGLLEVSRILRERGYVPMGVGNVAPAELVMWGSSVFFDSVYRDEIPLLDVLRRDGKVDGEEVLRGYHLGIIDPRDPQYGEMWRVFREWSETWNADFNSADGNMIRRDFLASRVAMMLTGCWMVQHILLDIADLPADERFDFAVFPLPNVTGETSPFFHAPLGAVGAVGVGFTLPADADARTRGPAIDWLQYLTSPENVEILQENSSMLPCIHGVRMRPELKGFLPLMDGTYPDLRIQEGFVFPDAQAADNWFRLFQDYLGERIELDEFTARWAPACAEGVARRIASERFDPAVWPGAGPPAATPGAAR